MARTARGVATGRRSVLVGVAAVVAGIFAIAPRTKDVPGKGLRRAFWIPFLGVPSGRLGRAGVRLLAKRHGAFAAMAKELDVTLSVLPVATKEHVFRGTKPADIG